MRQESTWASTGRPLPLCGAHKINRFLGKDRVRSPLVNNKQPTDGIVLLFGRIYAIYERKEEWMAENDKLAVTGVLV